MADKKITDLTLRSNVNDDVNFPVDDGVQTYRVTGPQVKKYVSLNPIATYTANQGLDSSNGVVLCDGTGGSFTVSLPAAASSTGQRYLIKKIDSDESKLITIDANSTELIDDAQTYILNELNELIEIVCNGTKWQIISPDKNKLYASSQVTTDSSTNSSGTFATYDNSPAFTIIPKRTGKLKVYCAAPILCEATGSQSPARIINTSGSATLLYESQGDSDNPTGQTISTVLIQSVYKVVAGTTYVFDIQGAAISGTGNKLTGANSPFYMFAERC